MKINKIKHIVSGMLQIPAEIRRRYVSWNFAGSTSVWASAIIRGDYVSEFFDFQFFHVLKFVFVLIYSR